MNNPRLATELELSKIKEALALNSNFDQHSSCEWEEMENALSSAAIAVWDNYTTSSSDYFGKLIMIVLDSCPSNHLTLIERDNKFEPVGADAYFLKDINLI